MRDRYKLKNGLPNWDVLDPLIIAARKSGASLKVLMQTFSLSKHSACIRLLYLADAGLIAPGRCANRRAITQEEKDIIVAEYATADTNELSERIGLSKKQIACAAKKYGIVRSNEARSEQSGKSALQNAEARAATITAGGAKEPCSDSIIGRWIKNTPGGQVFMSPDGFTTIHRSWRDDAAYARYLSSRRTA
jgi:hypothetical protein